MTATQSPLNIIVIGAGLGGLAAALALRKDGHNVTVLEAADTFGEVGAGIHLPPNSSRLLLRWGVDLGGPQTTSNKYHFIRFLDGSTIAKIPFHDVQDVHGAPYYLIHRADLHVSLLEAAKRAGAVVLSNARVTEYDFDAPWAKTVDGRVFNGDLIVAADGIKSVARPLLTGKMDKPQDTGDVAYRILLPGERLREDPELSPLLDDPCISSWCGPEAHIIGYPIRNGELYNVVICATSHGETTDEVWVVKGDNRELMERFSSWESRIHKLCALTNNFMKWRLCDVPNVMSWISKSGRACLLGDSCHPMLPYLAQGAAQAFEDAAALRQCLAREKDIPTALQCYQDIRMPRVTYVQKKTQEHQHIWHIDDGEEQIYRDEHMKRNNNTNPVFWGYDERKNWLFSHDAEILGKEGANWISV